MLRSLYSGISGLRSHQTMLDVTGNNIANVNTSGYKATAVQFQDTLSQLTQGATAPAVDAGGGNPAQVGLGVQVAGISTNFAQGSAQATGRGTDMMIDGDGFFVTRQGGQTQYTRAGAFNVDANGRLVTADGSLVQGWGAENGVVAAGGALTDLTIPSGAIAPAAATTNAALTGNLPEDAEAGTKLVRDLEVFDANGNSSSVPVTFTRTANGWDVSAKDATTVPLTFTAGKLTAPASPVLTVGGVAVDLAAITGYADVDTVAVTSQNGRSAGTLDSWSMAADGTLIGSFSNGSKQALGRIVLAGFTNPDGLEKIGGSSYVATANSGAAVVGGPGVGGNGAVAAGSLEMSNVDLSQEFTNLIVAQRGFQANARIITTSDEVLQELTNLKR
ncbi:flagellar hook protein FlgE [Arthrobacter gengyunqii]|uniref:Flagellar hook protein FlgE n=1 Tax=Arthrobacter gengyunqii TaxID=2886940 RepID=A0A9X1S7M8_9MICC|nr:flagellar hook protein FlgE [Arthrobacter gengyunqii]MCC3270928.1 flagellar hook protein FlgE [Arthrobacter gengyunqii]UOY96579.1 flagellar hook protein FlgE [Arthrobacter gengyunqii]